MTDARKLQSRALGASTAMSRVLQVESDDADDDDIEDVSLCAQTRTNQR